MNHLLKDFPGESLPVCPNVMNVIALKTHSAIHDVCFLLTRLLTNKVTQGSPGFLSSAGRPTGVSIPRGSPDECSVRVPAFKVATPLTPCSGFDDRKFQDRVLEQGQVATGHDLCRKQAAGDQAWDHKGITCVKEGAKVQPGSQARLGRALWVWQAGATIANLSLDRCKPVSGSSWAGQWVPSTHSCHLGGGQKTIIQTAFILTRWILT